MAGWPNTQLRNLAMIDQDTFLRAAFQSKHRAIWSLFGLVTHSGSLVQRLGVSLEYHRIEIMTQGIVL